MKLNAKKGTATLAGDLPGPGEVALEGGGVKPQVKQVGAGETILPVKATGKAKKKLTKKGKAKLTLSVTFTPTGGVPDDLSKVVKLKRKR